MITASIADRQAAESKNRMIEWEQWRTLLAVFSHGTYARAGKSLHVDATTVGRRLKLLERQVGCELFVRENDRLYPTRRCEAFLPHVEAAAEALRGAEQDVSGQEPGAVWRELRITAPPFLVANLLVPEIAALVQTHRVKVELMGTSNKLLLSRREADIALRIEDSPKSFKIDSERIFAKRIGLLRYAVYCARDSDPADLAWAGLIDDYERTTGSTMMDRLAGRDGFRYQVHHFDAVRELVASGVAQAMLPVVAADRNARLRRVSGVVLKQPLWLLYHRQDEDVLYMNAARHWIERIAQERLEAPLADDVSS
jgi:DNA-binding transcriptional LysR family regulator